MEKRVLVTGSAGFIGSHLTEELVKTGKPVRAMVRYNCQNNWGWLDTLPKEIMSGVEVMSGDICDPYFVRKAASGCATVYHLAALISIPYSYIAPASFVDTNVKGTLNVLQACRDEGVERVIHTSTSEVYGTAQYVPIDEKHPLVGQSPYSASKIGADKLAEAFYLSFKLPVTTVRPFNTFGPRQSARAVIPTLCTQVLSGAKVVTVGSVDPIRDFNYVKDTVRGFMAAANCERAIGQVINVGRGGAVSIRELVNLVLEISGSDAQIKQDSWRVRPEQSEVGELLCNNAMAQELLGWQPQYSFRQGLDLTIAWLRENLHRYKHDIYNV